MSCSYDYNSNDVQLGIFPYDEPKVTGPVKPWRTILNIVDIKDCDLKGSDAFTICTSYFDLYDKNCKENIVNCCKEKCNQSSKNPDMCIENCKKYAANFCQFNNINNTIENYSPNNINTKTNYDNSIPFGMPSGYDKYSVCVDLSKILSNNCQQEIIDCCNNNYILNENEKQKCQNFANTKCQQNKKIFEYYTPQQELSDKVKNNMPLIITISVIVLLVFFVIILYLHSKK
jgi:hypothetical protein